jgi:hypothetical protein
VKRTRKPRRNSRQRRRDAYWQRVEAVRDPFMLYALAAAWPEMRRRLGVTLGVDPDDVDRPKRRSRASGART